MTNFKHVYKPIRVAYQGVGRKKKKKKKAAYVLSSRIVPVWTQLDFQSYIVRQVPNN